MRRDGVVPTEHMEQASLIDWWGLAHKKLGVPQCLLYAVPNGGARNDVTGAMLKREGVRAGVPDLNLDYPRNGWHGLRIEMKRQRGGKVSEEQKHMLSELEAAGYRAVVCRGWQEAKAAIESYLGVA